MKQILVIALLIFSSSTIAQSADQQRRPAYQGYGTPVPTPEPEFPDDSEQEQAEAAVNLQIEAELASEPTSADEPVADEPVVPTEETTSVDQDTATDFEADAETDLEFATQPVEPPEQRDDEGPTDVLAPVIESSPLTAEPKASPRVLTAPPATLRLNGDKTLSSVISSGDEATDSTPEITAEPIPAKPVELSPARWQLDIVVFRAGGPQALRAERWDRNPGRPDVEQFDVISNSDANSLLEVIGRLDASPAHQPLLQRSLVFDQLPDFLRTRGAAFETTQAIIDADLVRGHSTMPTPASRFDWPEVLGTVKLKQGTALAVSVDLLFTYPTALPYRPNDTDDPFLEGGFELPADENLYQLGHIRLQQTADASAGKLLYFDNPAIGAIVNITELAPQPMEPPAPVLVDTSSEEPVSDDNTADELANETGTDNTEFADTDTQTIGTLEDNPDSEPAIETTSEIDIEVDSEADVENPDETPLSTDSAIQPENTDPEDPVAP